MSKYNALIRKINAYLAENYPGVSTYTDIFEHALLHSLGYNYIPEKCSFIRGDNENFYVELRAPYGVSNEQFVIDLQTINQPIIIQPIEPNPRTGNFVVRLTVPYELIEQADSKELLSSINYFLNNTEKYEFYKYWDQYKGTITQNIAFTMIFIENQLKAFLMHYPYASSVEIWNAIVAKANGSEKKLELLEKKIAIDMQNWPMIEFRCKDDSGEKLISLSRSAVVSLITNPANLKDYLVSHNQHEFILPHNIQNFVQEHLGRSFNRSEDDTYHIDLGYYSKKKLLKKFGIKELRSYRPQVASERSRYYVFDKENYIKTLLAIKEIEGSGCWDERLHSLKYYCDKEDWAKLEEQLDFFLNFKSHTGLAIDYAELAFKLFDYTEENKIDGSLDILYKAFIELTKNGGDRENIRRAHDILFKITIWDREQLDKETGTSKEKLRLEAKLFEHALAAGLPEANRFHMIASGFTGMEAPVCSDLINNPINVSLLECGTRIKEQADKIAELERQLIEARAQSYGQKVSSSSNQAGGPAFFQQSPVVQVYTPVEAPNLTRKN